MDEQWNYHDKPIEKETEDILDREHIASSIFDIVTKCNLENSLSIGVCGKWGSGKSSVINLVNKRINDDNKNKESKGEKCETRVIRFDPWIYTTQKDLTYEFLSILSYNLTGKILNCIKKGISVVKKGVKTVNKYLEPIAPISGSEALFKMLSAYVSLLCGDGEGLSLDDLKNKINEQLKDSYKESKFRVVVLIDDIDRLDENEILMVTKLVRSVADFSNIVYVLAYDEEIVSKALTCNSYNGSDYLQKIINISIQLPEVNNISIRNYIRQKYRSIVPIGTVNVEHETNVYDFCIEPYIETIRDVNIIMNRFKIKYELSKDNVCPIDLLAITLLEVKKPEIYKWISDNRYELCEPIYDSKEKDLLIRKSFAMEKLDVSYDKFISCLFPEYGYGSCYDVSCVENNHIHCKYSVNNYFWLSPEPSKPVNEEIRMIIDEIEPDEIVERLIYYSIENGHGHSLRDKLYKELSKSNLSFERRMVFLKILFFDEELIVEESNFRKLSNSWVSNDVITALFNGMRDMKKIIIELLPKDIARLISISWLLYDCKNSIMCSGDSDNVTIRNIIFNNISLSNKKSVDSLSDIDLIRALVLIGKVYPDKLDPNYKVSATNLINSILNECKSGKSLEYIEQHCTNTNNLKVAFCSMYCVDKTNNE